MNIGVFIIRSRKNLNKNILLSVFISSPIKYHAFLFLCVLCLVPFLFSSCVSRVPSDATLYFLWKTPPLNVTFFFHSPRLLSELGSTIYRDGSGLSQNRFSSPALVCYGGRTGLQVGFLRYYVHNDKFHFPLCVLTPKTFLFSDKPRT